MSALARGIRRACTAPRPPATTLGPNVHTRIKRAAHLDPERVELVRSAVLEQTKGVTLE